MTKRALYLTALLLVAAAASLMAHDMFLKLHSFLLEPHAPASVALLNGTFRESGNAIARDRMEDVSLVGPAPGDLAHPDSSRWRDSADTAVLDVRFGGAGTYLVGVSTRPRTFTLPGEDFDAYLRHDGVLDVLEERRAAGRLGTPATETYAKHAKAVVQVGTRRTGAYRRRLGYPAELVPLANPYRLAAGDTLPLLFLREGEPVAGQLVYASWEGYAPTGEDQAQDAAGDAGADPDDGGQRGIDSAAEDGGGPGAEQAAGREPVRVRTDAEGVARIPLSRPGTWYARLIHMVEVPDAPDVDYVSEWATLTWEVAGG